MNIIGITIALAALTWIIWTIVELKNLHRFKLPYFNRGFKIMSRKVSLQQSVWNYHDGIYAEKEARYVFIPQYRVGYFVSHFSFYRHHNVFFSTKGVPLTLFGEFKEQERKLRIEYRISYRVAALIALWMTIWLVFPLLTGKILGVGIAIGGLLFNVLFLGIIYFYQRGKMLIISDEIEALLHTKRVCK